MGLVLGAALNKVSGISHLSICQKPDMFQDGMKSLVVVRGVALSGLEKSNGRKRLTDEKGVVNIEPCKRSLHREMAERGSPRG
jgi:hypothetical protein